MSDQIRICPLRQTVASLVPWSLNLQKSTYSLCFLMVAKQFVGRRLGEHLWSVKREKLVLGELWNEHFEI